MDNTQAGSIQTQLEESLKGMATLEDGQFVSGNVIQVTDAYVFLDIGYKAEGRIPVVEFEQLPKIGDNITVVLMKKDGAYGPVLSKAKADAKRIWKEIRIAFEKHRPIMGTIKRIVKGGFDVDLGGDIHAFLPISQADDRKIDEPRDLLDKKVEFLIERLSLENKANIVVNRRKLLLALVDKARNKFFESAQVGDVVKGTVKSFTSFGAFVDLGGFDGLLHINDMSWGHVTKPKQFVKKGQEIELKVIKLDPEGKRINLSLKHFTDDPWVHFEEKYHVNDIVKGKVTKLTEFGAFIELEEGIEGLAHISEFSWTKKIDKPADMVKEGQEVECMILGYDIRGGRVSLGLKQVHPDPRDSIEEKYPVDKQVRGKVVKITNSGAFIEMEEGIDGFVSADDFTWFRKIKHLNNELKIGQEIDCKVLDSNNASHRLKLGIKQLSPNPWVDFAQQYTAGSVLEGEITSITDFGLFVKAPNGIEGLVNKSNIIENDNETFEDAIKRYKVGDKINVYVVDINVSKEKVAFSVKEFKKKQTRDEISQYMSSSGNDTDDAYTLGDLMKNKNN